MRTYIICPSTKEGSPILVDNLEISASSAVIAKEKAKVMFPGCDEYIIIDILPYGFSAIQRDREKSGFGM